MAFLEIKSISGHFKMFHISFHFIFVNDMPYLHDLAGI